MKGSNSRQNFDAKTRFSNLFQVQGGMITDADLDEKALIAQARDEVITSGAIQSGVPDVGGIIVYQDDKPFVRPGLVYAQGKAGRFALANPLSAESKLEAIFRNQADFREAPPLPEGPQLIYADLWERTISAGQDAALTDPGLHGTETSYRTKTMVQLKSMPLEDNDFDAIQATMDNDAQFAAKGAATLGITLTESDIQVSGCDPCADQIVVDDTLPNMLWRLEIVDVAREVGSNRPISLRVAWSAENAAVMDRNTSAGRDGVGREQSVFQFLSDETETHQGWLPAGFKHHRSEFSPEVETIPNPRDEEVFTHVRRWDAMAEIHIDGSAVTNFMGGTKPNFSNQELTIQTRFFQATLTLDKHNMMIGDYWLVEVRRFARDGDQIRLIGANGAGQALPIGMEHHYCPLIISDGQDSQKPSQALRQITQMPTLSTLRSEDVGYTPPENCPVYGQADNVKTALDAICSLEAKNVSITPPPGCDTLAEADNVQDALAALCAADNERNLRVMLRTMMDWGVVCGLRLTADPNNASVIRYTGGTALNREGLLRELGDGELDLNKFEKDQIHGELAKLQSFYGEICLSVELQEDGDPRFHLSSPSYPYVDSDKTFKQRIASCLQNESRIDDSEVLAKLGDKEMLILSKVMTSWTNRKAVGRAFEINEEELEIGLAIFTKLKDEFLKQQDEATQARLDTLVKGADAEFQQRLKNEASDTPNQRLRYLVALFGILARVEADGQSNCTCAAALPGCSVHGENKPVLIPIGCVKLAVFDEGKLVLNEVCDLCCRKLAHTWHNYRYYFGDQMADQIKEYEDTCCSYFDDAAGLEDFLDRWTPTEDQLDPNSGSPFWPPDPGISNQIGRRGPDVRGVNLERTKEILAKTGVKLNDEFIFERKEGELFERIREQLGKPANRPLGLVFEARTEDEVGLIVDSGTVVDLFVVKASPYYGFNNVKGREVVIEGGGTGDGGTFDLAGADFRQNPDFANLFDTVGELLDGNDGPNVTVDGGTLPITTNPSIRGLQNQLNTLQETIDAAPQPVDPIPFDILGDTEFVALNARVSSLQEEFAGFEISGRDIDLTNNETIRNIQRDLVQAGSGSDITLPDYTQDFADIWAAVDEVAQSARDVDIAGDPTIIGIQDTLTALQNGEGINANNLNLSSNLDFQSLEGRIGQPGDATLVDGATLDLSDNPAITGLLAELSDQPTPYSLAKDPLYVQMQGTLGSLQDGSGINADGLVLRNNPDFQLLQGQIEQPEDAAPVDGTTLDLTGNPAITGLQEELSGVPDPYNLAADPLFRTLQTRLGQVENGTGIDGSGIDLSNNAALDGLGATTTPDGTTLDISGNQSIKNLNSDISRLDSRIDKQPDQYILDDDPAFSNLQGRMGAVEAGSGINAGGLNLGRNQAFSNLRNDVPTNLVTQLGNIGTRLGNVENQAGLTLDQVMADERIQALIAELADCKLMIKRMSPLAELFPKAKLGALQERGITTAGAAFDAGKEGLGKIVSDDIAAQMMVTLTEHLSLKK